MSCFGGRDEQIYLIEVLVNKLSLTPGKIKDIGDHPIVIKIKILDFPVFEITREDFDSLEPKPRDEDGTLHFMTGRSCLFIRQPKDLVRQLRSTNLKVGVFRVGDTYPTAETEVTLSGCLCDQITMIANDSANLPKPFTVKGDFHLVDPGENPSGTIGMELRLTCFGRSLMTHYEMRQKFFVFRNDDCEREFKVERLVPEEYRKEQKEPLKEVEFEKVTEKEEKRKGKSKGKKGKGGKRGKK